MSATSGITHAVPGVCGEETTGKPKSAGSPSAIEVQETPASSVRKTPKWFCAYIRSGPLASTATLCTHWPYSGSWSGTKTAVIPCCAAPTSRRRPR